MSMSRVGMERMQWQMKYSRCVLPKMTTDMTMLEPLTDE